jgi:hypothetical protein
METEILSFKGSANAKIDFIRQAVDFYEYGEYRYCLSFDEIKEICEKIELEQTK